MKVVARLCAAATVLLICGATVQGHTLNRVVGDDALVTGPAPATADAPSTAVDSLSGTIRGRGGQPVPNATIFVSIGAFSDFTTTNSLGQYSLTTDPGPAYIQIAGSGPAGVAPGSFYLQRYDVTVSGPTILDIDLPVALLTGLVKNQDGTAAAGATLNFSAVNFFSTGLSVSSAEAASAGDGSYSVLLLTGSVTALVTPASTTQIPLSDAFTLTGDAVRNFQFTSSVAVDGTVRGRSGQPVPGALVTISVGSTSDAATTDGAGHYLVHVASGSAFVQIQGGGPSGTAPSDFYLERYDVVVSGATTADFDLPVIDLHGTVKDGDGNGVGSARLDFSTTGSLAGGRSTSDTTAATDANGAYDVLLLGGVVDAAVTPPSFTNLTSLTRTFSVTTDATQDFVLASSTVLSGTVTGRGGVPVPNLSVSVTIDSTTTIGQTDQNGQYSLQVPTGVADIQVFGGGPSSVPASVSYERSGVTVSGVTTFDVDLSAAQVSGVVVDANGVVVPGVVVSASSTDSQGDRHTSSSSFATTAADGTFSYLLLTGSADASTAPPAGSGFANGAQSFAVPGDVTLRLTVQHDDVTPPVLTTGPVVVHLSATSATVAWSTNRASTSTVEFGIGTLSQSSDDTALTTDHMVTLTGLVPATLYSFRVGSSDAAGNGPAFSPESTFRTQAGVGDAAAPVFTTAPTPVFADQTSVIVEWTTDEPASSVVEFGSPAVTVDGDPGHFRFVHRVILSGLTASTQYSAVAHSTDPDGNTVASAPFNVVTLGVPDVAPAIITAGPVAVAVTDTRIVLAWITDEPATGGVSFNDGTAYDLVQDGALTRSHQMTLANLSPGTLYHVTVSSTDADGNGPTLSATFDVTTASVPDTTAPTISGLQVTDVTQSSAVLTWTTDEFANAVATFGPVAGSPDSVTADVVLSTPHRLLLNGLQPGTPYFFVVTSTDEAGNTVASSESSFTTVPVIVDLPPTAPGSVTGPTSPTRLATITISWSAATDDNGVVGYDVYRDGGLIGSVDGSTLSFDDTTAAEGSHEYRVAARDGAGQTALSGPLTIVVDRTPPQLNLPGNIVADAVLIWAKVNYTVSATDNLDTTVAVTCSPPSGSIFLVGVTNVSCSATDTAGNTATGGFTVTVRDVTPPILLVPFEVVREATSPSGAVVTFLTIAVDLVDGIVTPVCTPASGSTFALGSTTVTCTATDAAGNSTTKSFAVHVVDTKAPVITAFTPSQSVLWPPNHEMVPLTVTVVVHDIVDPAPVCSIVSIQSNEPVNGLGDGDTAPDWTFSGLSFSVRAERGAHGHGRIYTINGQCRDAAGNTSHASTTVTVPKNQ